MVFCVNNICDRSNFRSSLCVFHALFRRIIIHVRRIRVLKEKLIVSHAAKTVAFKVLRIQAVLFVIVYLRAVVVITGA